jgi:hypothetical protein
MLKSALAALALFAATPALAQTPPPPAPTPVSTAAQPLTVDSPLRKLVLDPRTRPIIDKHMPGFAERMMSDPDVGGMFGGVSLAGLQHDPHVQGMTPQALAKIGAELAEAQKPPAS